jgi:Protein of unknown function (DUF429)
MHSGSVTRGAKIVIGIDVGSPARGFHAVALGKGKYFDKLHTFDTRVLADWCRSAGAQAVGIDAPCRWSVTGRARRAERELMAQRIWCFSTPSIEIAKSHRSNYFGWMLQGAALYAELVSSGYALFDGKHSPTRAVCFETFPHAVACAMQGSIVSAKQKRVVRRKLLQQSGVDTGALTNIDWVDAGLCALTAHRLLGGSVDTYGDIEEGFIVVPK